MPGDDRLALGLAEMMGGAREKPIGGEYTLADADRRISAAERAVIEDASGTPYIPIEVVAADGDGAALHVELTGLGLNGGGSHGNLASGLMPVAALGALEGVSNMALARPALAVANAGTVVSQDVAALRADVARHLFDVDGSGLTIGILSDSFATAEDPLTTFEEDLAAGELPDVEILQDLSRPGIDEGRAMAQLIHDIAPGADILFATASEGPASFAANIDALVDAGADIIVDDIFYFAEPMFQDGVIAQAAARAVEAGVPFFSAVGNHGIAGYEAPFRATDVAGPSGGALHDWDSGAGVDPFLDIVVPAGTSASLILQWDDPFLSGSFAGPAGTSSPGADTDLDFYLLDEASDEATIIAEAATFNLGGDPLEVLVVENTGEVDLDAALVIENFAGADPGTMRIVGVDDVPFDDFVRGYGVEYEDEFRASTTFGHAVAEGVTGVGASEFFLTPAFGAVERPFPSPETSLGGSTILFDESGVRLARPDVRDAVDITASDSGNTTFFGEDLEGLPAIFPDGDPDADTLPNFSGTSAAAPNAAAVAALMLEATPSLGPEEVEVILEATAQDIVPDFALVEGDILDSGFFTVGGQDALAVGVAPGPDDRTGAGLVDAVAAVAVADIAGGAFAALQHGIPHLEDEFAFAAGALDAFWTGHVADAHWPARLDRHVTDLRSEVERVAEGIRTQPPDRFDWGDDLWA